MITLASIVLGLMALLFATTVGGYIDAGKKDKAFIGLVISISLFATSIGLLAFT